MIRVLFTVALMVAILMLGASNHDHHYNALILSLATVQAANVALYFSRRRRP